MEHLLNPKAREIEISGIRKFSNLVAQHEDVISLTIGQPDFFTPHHVKAAAKKAIDENVTSYTPNAGYLELFFLLTRFSLPVHILEQKDGKRT